MLSVTSAVQMSSGSIVGSEDAGLASVTAMDPGHRIEDKEGDQLSNANQLITLSEGSDLIADTINLD